MTRTPLSRSKVTRPLTYRSVNASGSGERGDVLTMRTYCYVAVGSAGRDALAPTEG